MGFLDREFRSDFLLERASHRIFRTSLLAIVIAVGIDQMMGTGVAADSPQSEAGGLQIWARLALQYHLLWFVPAPALFLSFIAMCSASRRALFVPLATVAAASAVLAIVLTLVGRIAPMYAVPKELLSR